MGTTTVLFDLPYAVDEPQLAQPSLGIDRLTRRGPSHSYSIDVTVLDTPDHRLIRAGVWLAHRVCDGLGDWYLDAPGWRELLPDERREPMDAFGDLPEDFARWVQPFRRRSALGAVAGLGLERVEYLIRGRDKHGDPVELGVLRDDRLTVRRGGVTTVRTREVSIRPRAAMSPPQLQWLLDRLADAGGTQVEQFPSLRQRLGAPATGLSDFPEPGPITPETTLDAFVSAVLAQRLRALVVNDLALRTGESEPAALAAEMAGLLDDLRALSGVLEPGSREALEADATVTAGLLASRASSSGLPEKYYEVIDALVLAVRAPRIGDLSGRTAVSVLRQQAEAAAVILVDRCGSLMVGSPAEQWQAALNSVEQLTRVARVAGPLMRKRHGKLRKALRQLRESLQDAAERPREPDPASLLALGPVEAFEAGREFELARSANYAAQADFVEIWPGLRKQLAKSKLRP